MPKQVAHVSGPALPLCHHSPHPAWPTVTPAQLAGTFDCIWTRMPLANVKMPTLGGLENRAAPPGPMLRGAGQAALERESHRDGGPGHCRAAWDTQWGRSAVCAVKSIEVWHSMRLLGSKRVVDLPTADHS
jgi:hypothetical protein